MLHGLITAIERVAPLIALALGVTLVQQTFDEYAFFITIGLTAVLVVRLRYAEYPLQCWYSMVGSLAAVSYSVAGPLLLDAALQGYVILFGANPVSLTAFGLGLVLTYIEIKAFDAEYLEYAAKRRSANSSAYVAPRVEHLTIDGVEHTVPYLFPIEFRPPPGPNELDYYEPLDVPASETYLLPKLGAEQTRFGWEAPPGSIRSHFNRWLPADKRFNVNQDDSAIALDFIPIKVDRVDNEFVKQLGAVWLETDRTWAILPGKLISVFRSWLPLRRDRLYLVTQYADRNQVKALGANWDPDKHRWYLDTHQPTAGFEPWLP